MNAIMKDDHFKLVTLPFDDFIHYHVFIWPLLTLIIVEINIHSFATIFNDADMIFQVYLYRFHHDRMKM